MKKTHWLHTIITAIILFGLTTLIYFYSSGYRLIRNDTTNSSIDIDLKKTGMINARSIPEGANVYVNDVFTTATNDNVPALNPGKYTLSITKNGYYPWKKDIEVYAELVTDITALLIPQTPRFEPLTTKGAREPVVSPTLTKIAYFSKDPQNSGISVIPLTSSGLNLFRTNPETIIEDTLVTVFSNGKTIEWSPDETELLVRTSNDNFYLIGIEQQSKTLVLDPQVVRDDWESKRVEQLTQFVQKLNLPEDIFEFAIAKETLWSPDQKKFLYQKPSEENEAIIEYRVFNMENPLPVGEKEDSLVFTKELTQEEIEYRNKMAEQKANEEVEIIESVEEQKQTIEDEFKPATFISWYADSFHLILSENFDKEANLGKISLIRIDGTNKTTIYESIMYSEKVYSTPEGDKLIFLTSFTPAKQTDLYTIGLR